MIIGLPGSGSDFEFEIITETPKAYRLKDNLGNKF